MRRALLVSMVLGGTAFADEPPPRYEIVRATVVASGSARNAGPENVLDQDLTSAWCTEAGAGGVLTVELTRAVSVDRVVVTPGVVDAEEDTLDRPVALELSLDDKELQPIRVETPDADSIAVEVPAGSVRKVALRVGAGGARACIAGLSLERSKQAHSLLRLLDDGRLAELTSTLARLRAAMAACDAGTLAELSAFPLAYDVVDREGVSRRRGKQRQQQIRYLGQLMEACRPRPFQDTGVREIDADTVAVWAGGDFVLKYKRPGGWKLVELADDYPRR